MNKDVLKAEMKAFHDKVKAAREELNVVAKKQFKEFSTQLFDIHPNLELFGWTQYTPYFNDGDECIFGVNDCFVVMKNQLEEYQNGDHWDFASTYNETDKERIAAFKDIRNFLSNFEDEDMQHMFGDHIKVEVTRSGVVTEEYSHD